MSINHMTSALTLVAALALPHVSHAESTADSAGCFLDPQSVFTVQPYYGRPTISRNSLRGAEVKLVPVVGLSSEMLAARLKRLLRATERGRLPGCLRDVGHVHIGSNLKGDAESVMLIAKDPSNAHQVLRRAQMLDGTVASGPMRSSERPSKSRQSQAGNVVSGRDAASSSPSRFNRARWTRSSASGLPKTSELP
jgi:hypothetical protein